MNVHGKDLEGTARGVGHLFGDRYVEDLLPGLATVGRPVNPSLTVPGRRGGGQVDRSRLAWHEGEAFLPAQVEGLGDVGPGSPVVSGIPESSRLEVLGSFLAGFLIVSFLAGFLIVSFLAGFLVGISCFLAGPGGR